MNTEDRMRAAAHALPPSDFGSTRAIQAAAAVADAMVAEALALVSAADTLERFVAAREPGADPATDDLTVPLAIELSEKQALIAEMLAALKRLLATINVRDADSHAPGCRCVIHEARAAIAKAEGR